ncbi:hypothetical protein V1478_008344 [Vespula squamosa]|uniref:Uncharacterized protein n=1 Tax=Vespula squamosa TaxID=30214 RepID=A0ABD2AYJ2_VESSQ
MLPSDHPPWPRIVLTPLDSGSSRQSSDILDVIVPLFRSNMRLSLSRDICFSSIAFVFHESFDQQRLLLCSRIENFGQDVATYSGKGSEKTCSEMYLHGSKNVNDLDRQSPDSVTSWRSFKYSLNIRMHA